VLVQETFDTDPGWSRGGEWAFGSPTGGGTKNGNPDPVGGFTGANVYGVKIDGDYKTNPGGPFFLTAGPFDTSGYSNTRLDFYRWLNTDAATAVTATVDVSNDGSTWHNLYTNPAATPVTDSAWQLQQLDMSAYADDQPAVYVRWGYPTLGANDGARHVALDGGPLLGARVDPDEDGRPNAPADGDDRRRGIPRAAGARRPRSDRAGGRDGLGRRRALKRMD
jgi:hypothetical protein